ncbi:MAG TPA: hypothetical protein VH134_07050 [Candidatus Dormibacteraeota bacterium]|jgi:hypothetical protein|nr:hypothetical protein [Candidatus Dormibacteraeota bacterium]
MPTSVDFLILCDAAQVSPDSKLHLLGGAWTHHQRQVPQNAAPGAPPPISQFAIAAGFLVDWNEAGNALLVRISVEDDDNRVLAQVSGQLVVSRPAGAIVGTDQRALFAVPVAMAFERSGPHHVRAGIEGREVDKVTHFTVVDVPAG